LGASQSVQLAWDPSPDSSVTGYKIYYGISTRSYTNAVALGNVTNTTIVGLLDKVTYYFTATATNRAGLESDYSNEAVYTVPDPEVMLTYVGVRLEWWTNMAYINRQNFMLATFVNSPPSKFYRASLIVTNDLRDLRIVDLKSRLEWWTNLTTVNKQVYNLKSFTNSPSPQFYRSLLIITNRPF
jgi:hypothetical protein